MSIAVPLYGFGGKMVKRASGTFTTGTTGKATVNCGFQPDFVVITWGLTDTSGDSGITYPHSCAAAFHEEGYDAIDTAMWAYNSTAEYWIEDIYVTRTSAGFTVEIARYDDPNGSGTAESKMTYNYTAVKYT